MLLVWPFTPLECYLPNRTSGQSGFVSAHAASQSLGRGVAWDSCTAGRLQGMK